MRYLISTDNPASHFIAIEFVAGKLKGNETLLQLPAWRPGRYELGNFAKNIGRFAVSDENGKPLKFTKLTKDLWKVYSKGANELHVKYTYFAAEINAGSTYLDKDQLYMNPVNCCFYIPGRIGEECELELILPKGYKIATAMKKLPPDKDGSNPVLFAKDFHELADSPLIASATLQHNMFVLDGVEFNLWFQGECKPEWSSIICDFFIFINEQFMMMKEFPCEAYHFLFQAMPQKFHHGVEHLTSTVIAFGPGYNLMYGETYEDFLGVSSHELFHSWNIKSIRPVEMQPYDYTKENYSRLGYVCEGVTTYYGDLFLFRSGVYTPEEFNKQINARLQKHLDNFGRFNLSVADSSFDTWLDGYGPGIPDRKTSIYDEGCILAFMTDLLIRKHSENRNSLDDVMRYLYFEFAKHGKGYSEKDYRTIVEQLAGAELPDLFEHFVNGANSYESAFSEALSLIGYKIYSEPARKYQEKHWGIKTSEAGGIARVIAVFPDSPAAIAGLAAGDEIAAVNGCQIKGDGSGTNLHEWARHFGTSEVLLSVFSSSVLNKVSLKSNNEVYYRIFSIDKASEITDEQRKNYESWSKRRFIL